MGIATDMIPVRTSTRSWLALLLLVVAMSACGPRTKQQRQAHGEKRTDEAAALLSEAAQHLRNLDADKAEPLLEEAEEVLDHPDVDLTPEGDMLYAELDQLLASLPRVRQERARREQAPALERERKEREAKEERERKEREAKAERERKELEAAVEKQRDAVVEAMFAVTESIDALDRKDANGTQVTAAREAIQRTRERLRLGKELEAKNADYAASARSTERRLEQAEARLQLAQQVIDFISGPLDESRQAPELEKKARKERDLDARLSLYTEVHERFRRCESEAAKLLAERPELARSPMPTPKGRPTTLKAVATGCKKKAGSLQRMVTKLEKAKVRRDKALERKEKLKAAREAAREKARARKRR